MISERIQKGCIPVTSRSFLEALENRRLLSLNNDLDAGGFFVARASPAATNGPPAPGGGAQFKLADVSFVVTSLLGGPSTQINFRPRASLPGSAVGAWFEDGVRKDVTNQAPDG